MYGLKMLAILSLLACMMADVRNDDVVAILRLLACRMADVRNDDVGNLKTSGLYDGGCTG